MTRVPIFTDPRGTTPTQIAVPTGRIAIPRGASANITVPRRVTPTGIGIAGQAFAQALKEMGARRIRAYRARTLTDVETNANTAVGEAEVEAFKADSAESERVYKANAKLAEVRAQVNAITDTFIRGEANDILERVQTRGLLRVRGLVVRAEVQEGRAALQRAKESHNTLIGTGKRKPSEAYGDFEREFELFGDAAYNPEDAQAFLNDTRTQFFRTYVDLLLYGNDQEGVLPAPDQVEAFLDSPAAREALTTAQRRSLRNLGLQRTEEAQREIFDQGLSNAREELSVELALDSASHEEYAKLVDDTAQDMTVLGGFKDRAVSGTMMTKDDVKRYLLGRSGGPIEAAALNGDVRRFEIAVMSLPRNSSDSLTIAKKYQAVLLRVLATDNKLANAEGDVEDALLGGWRLEHTDWNQRVVDQLDASETANLWQQAEDSGQPTTQSEIDQKRIDRWGKTTMMPTDLTRKLISVIQSGDAHSAEAISDAQDALGYMRRTAPAAYEKLPSDIRKAGLVWERVFVTGSDPKAMQAMVDDMVNPPDPAKQAGFDFNRTIHFKNAMSYLAEQIKDDKLFKMDLTGDLIQTRLGNMDLESGTTFDLTAIGDTIPQDLISKFWDAVSFDIRSGVNPEGAMAKAYVEVVQNGGYGKSTSFSDHDDPSIRELEPVRLYGFDSVETFEMDMAGLILLAMADGIANVPLAAFEEGESPPPTISLTEVSRTKEEVTGAFDAFGRPIFEMRPDVISLQEHFGKSMFKEMGDREDEIINLGPLLPDIEADGEERLKNDMAFMRGANFRIVRPDHIETFIRWGREHLLFLPHGNQDEGLVGRGPNGEPKTLYNIYYIDKLGIRHPWSGNEFNTKGEAMAVGFLIQPDVEAGRTHMLKKASEGVTAQKKMRDRRLRIEQQISIEKFFRPSVTTQQSFEARRPQVGATRQP